MYNKIKVSIFLIAIIFGLKALLVNAAHDIAPLVDSKQMQNKEVNLAEPTSRSKPVYLIVQHTILDTKSYTQDYAIPVVKQLQDIGAKVLAVSSEPQVLEGKWEPKSTVIIKFPSMSIAKKWYSSVDYKPLKELRINKLTEEGKLVLVPGFTH